MNRIALYPVANYGSAMTPFYTVLSIWVGAIILVAMMKVSVSDREKAKVLGLGETLPMGETMGVKEAVIAGRTAGPGAMLDGSACTRIRSISGDTPFSARWRCCRARWYAWATCSSSACNASIRCSS